MKHFILHIIVLFTALSAIANDRLYIKDFEIAAGETKTIVLILENDTAYSAFQTDIYLSDGLEIEQEYGEYIIDLNPDRAARTHAVSTFKREDGAIRVFVTAQNMATFNGNSGDIAYILIKATDAFPGSGTISLKNTIAAEANATRHVLDNEVCHVNPEEMPSIRGDVDGDGVVTIADVTTLINIILRGENNSGADVDEDGRISIDDVTTLINYLLCGNWP